MASKSILRTAEFSPSDHRSTSICISGSKFKDMSVAERSSFIGDTGITCALLRPGIWPWGRIAADVVSSSSRNLSNYFLCI